MKNKEELIWTYLDGQLNAEDRARVETALETDPSFKELFLQSQLLHKNMQVMEAEGPSLRFTQNVMDRLPTVKNLATGPLVSMKWLRSFYGGVIALIALLLGSTAALVPVSSTQAQSAEEMIDRVNSIFGIIPANMLFMAGIIIISLLILLSLDRYLENRFNHS